MMRRAWNGGTMAVMWAAQRRRASRRVGPATLSRSSNREHLLVSVSSTTTAQHVSGEDLSERYLPHRADAQQGRIGMIREKLVPMASALDQISAEPIGFDGHGRTSPAVTRKVDYTRSPPAMLAVVPVSRKAFRRLRPTVQRWTSSGPSTRRCERIWVYQRASGVSWL